MTGRVSETIDFAILVFSSNFGHFSLSAIQKFVINGTYGTQFTSLVYLKITNLNTTSCLTSESPFI